MNVLNTAKKSLVAFYALTIMSLFFAPAIIASNGKDMTANKSFPGISVQLWSVHKDVQNDFNSTLKTIAEMGFDAVELAGEFGEFKDEPEKLKMFLDDLGLSVSGAHVGTEQLRPENIDKTIAYYKAVGTNLLIIPWDDRAWDPNRIDELVNELNQFSSKLAAHGMFVGYHNHAEEFQDFQDATFWDYIASNTNENVVLQLDTGWVIYSDKDPVEYVKRYPGRTVATHIKRRTHEGSEVVPLIGQDGFDWQSLVIATAEVGGTKWLVVEQEEYPNEMTPLESVAASKSGLSQIIAAMK